MANKRQFYSNGIFHIMSRGSKKEPIFIDNYDYYRFIKKIKEYSDQTKDTVIHYCLLPNHFHLLVKARQDNSISKLMHRLLTSHSKYICSKYKFVGSIFQDRYRAVSVVSQSQLMIVSRYIHRNPIEYFNNEKLFTSYRWSSFKTFTREDGTDKIIGKRTKKIILGLFANPEEYFEFVTGNDFVLMSSIKTSLYKLHQE